MDMFQYDPFYNFVSYQEPKRNPTMIYFIGQSCMKPSEKTSVPEILKYFEIKHYILHDEVQKREVVLQYIYISTDEKISIHFGKASIQDEITCILKLELMETTLLTGREDSPS